MEREKISAEKIEENIFNSSELEEKISRLQKEILEKDILIDELKKELKLVRKEAMFDELTGFDKRKHFILEATKIISSLRKGGERREEGYQNLSFLFCDIDYFKNINDTYGHEAGDIVLKETAKFFKSKFRENDRICRWGGEEIVIMLLGADEKEAVLKAEKIRDEIKELNFPEYPKIKISLSIGAAVYKIGEPFNETIKKADKAMYVAKKERGKDNVVSFSEIK